MNFRLMKERKNKPQAPAVIIQKRLAKIVKAHKYEKLNNNTVYNIMAELEWVMIDSKIIEYEISRSDESQYAIAVKWDIPGTSVMQHKVILKIQ